MLFSNIETEALNFLFNGKIIPTTDVHKHLGVTFSSNAKWTTHIDNIVSSVSKHLNILRKLKYKLNRSNLEKLYLVFIRPIFEYACEVWDNCGIVNATKLEKLQLEAARIVSGLPIFTELSSIYFTELSSIYRELGWET